MKVQWLDSAHTHAMITRGWLRRRTAEVHALSNSAYDWYYGPPFVRSDVHGTEYFTERQRERDFYVAAIKCSSYLSAALHNEQLSAKRAVVKAREKAQWTRVRGLPKAKLLPSRTGSLTEMDNLDVGIPL